ncbi:putative disease resistance protein RGA3 [Carex rostrata]
MASALFSSIQSLSTKLLEAIRGLPSTSHQQDPPSPVTDQQKSVREDLEKLSRMITRIQAIQQDAEEREIHDSSVRLWLAELRGVAYQAEDVLDEFNYEVLRFIVESGDAVIEAYHRDGGTKRKFDEMSCLASYSFTTKVSIPDGMAEKFKGIIERFEEISNARRDLHLREEDGTRRIVSPQIRLPTSSHMDERAIFGREEEKEKIISLLNPSNGPDFMVLPIVGMGGFGKTTLAKIIYNDSRICQVFDKRCWVSVSVDFDLVRLTKAIVESVSNNPSEFSELSKLQDVLKEKIRGLSLFLVLDDVWNDKGNLWECFSVVFFCAKFVRILTMTRNTSVANIMQTTSPLQLSSLPEENCWSLFKHFTFGNRETSEDANLHEIGRGIVKNCKGSPLAVKALGGILRYEMDEEKWREILESDISEIDENGEIIPALWLSYHKLPQHLKPCFLYLSMFPKGTPFVKDMVVNLWMAQGYVNGNTRNLKTLEEIGSEYFDELQGRSLVERALVDGGLFCTDFFPANFYVLHDLMHDLARSISQEAYRPVSENVQQCSSPCKVYHLYLTKQDKLLGSVLAPGNYGSIRTIVNECPTQIFDNALSCEIGCMRALHLRYSLFQNTFGIWKHLRYLFLENSQMETLPETLCVLYNLQILDLKTFSLRKLPENIKNLINLRYFRLNSSKIQQLPEYIFLLRNLRTLSLNCCMKIKELPRGIEQLTRLHFLYLPESLIYMPPGIGKLTTLKSALFGKFSVMDHGMIGGLGELKDMNDLRWGLCLSGLKNISDAEYSKNANLASKPNLYGLGLNFQEDPSCLIVTKLPKLHLDVQSSTNSKNKNDEKIQEAVLQNLQPHGNLRRLLILNYGGRIFPSWLHIPLLPKLTHLVLNFCTEPNFIPPFGQLSYLRDLRISGNTEVRNVGDELNTYSLLTEYGRSKQPREPSYPSLTTLSLNNLLNLGEWQAHDGDFPRLVDLTIENCPKLEKIGIIPQKVWNVTFKYCPKLKLLTCQSVIERLTIHDCGFHKIMFRSVSKNLTISNCVELISVNSSDGGLNSVEEVSFESCPKLELPTITTGIKTLKIAYCSIQEIVFPLQSSIQMVDVFHCPMLTSIQWVKSETLFHRNLLIDDCPEIHKGLKNVRLSHCPILQFPLKDVLHSMTQGAEIYDCPRMDLGERYVYQRDTTIEVLNLFGNNEIRLSSVNSTIPFLEKSFRLSFTKEDFQEVESLTWAPLVGVSCQCIMLNLASLVILNILSCRMVISVTGLDNLINLKRLRISYCTELWHWNDIALPLSLKFLKVDSCDKLSSLPLLSIQNHSSTLEVLVIKKCPRLAVLEGFHGLVNLKTVELLHCRNISIYPCTESLQFRPLITIGDCPLMRDWCQRNSITYNEFNPIDNSPDNREDEEESLNRKVLVQLKLFCFTGLIQAENQFSLKRIVRVRILFYVAPLQSCRDDFAIGLGFASFVRDRPERALGLGHAGWLDWG